MFYQQYKEGFCMEYKRHRTASKDKMRTTGAAGTAILIILSLAVIAAIIVLSPAGKYLMEHVITPVVSCIAKDPDEGVVSALKQQEKQASPATSAQPTPEGKKHQVIMIEETPFYILQMGAFTDSDAANQRAEEIRRLGAGGVVFRDGKAFRVFAAAYLTESNLMKVQSQVRSDGFEATPFITESASAKLTLEGAAGTVDLVKIAADQIGVIPTELSRISLSFDKNEMNQIDLLNKLTELRDLCRTSVESLGTISNDDIASIKDLLQKYDQNISTFLSEHDTINADRFSGDLKALQLSCIADYILFFERE